MCFSCLCLYVYNMYVYIYIYEYTYGSGTWSDMYAHQSFLVCVSAVYLHSLYQEGHFMLKFGWSDVIPNVSICFSRLVSLEVPNTMGSGLRFDPSVPDGWKDKGFPHDNSSIGTRAGWLLLISPWESLFIRSIWLTSLWLVFCSICFNMFNSQMYSVFWADMMWYVVH